MRENRLTQCIIRLTQTTLQLQQSLLSRAEHHFRRGILRCFHIYAKIQISRRHSQQLLQLRSVKALRRLDLPKDSGNVMQGLGMTLRPPALTGRETLQQMPQTDTEPVKSIIGRIVDKNSAHLIFQAAVRTAEHHLIKMCLTDDQDSFF